MYLRIWYTDFCTLSRLRYRAIRGSYSNSDVLTVLSYRMANTPIVRMTFTSIARSYTDWEGVNVIARKSQDMRLQYTSVRLFLL